MVTHLGIPLQTRKTDFGLDGPVSEVSVTTLSSNNQKYQNILKLSGMKKNFWMKMELSHQVVSLKQFCLGLFSKKQDLHVYSFCVPSKFISGSGSSRFAIYLFVPARHILLIKQFSCTEILPAILVHRCNCVIHPYQPMAAVWLMWGFSRSPSQTLM